MCVTPRILWKAGLKRVVECHECWQCKANRVNDWEGRCIAESKSCVGASFVSLSYGNDVHYGTNSSVHAVDLFYSDVQKWLKRIRKAGFPVRYLVAGEFGPAKGRTHWHALLFWSERVPPVPHDGKRNWNDKFWAHGNTVWEPFDVSNVRYVTKYITKGEGRLGDLGMVRQTTKPILGAAWFKRLAERYIDAGLPLPLKPEYRFDDLDGSRLYWMSDSVLNVFCEHYLAVWRARFGPDSHPPYSPVLEAWEDRNAVRSTLVIPRVYERRYRPHIAPPVPAEVQWSRSHNNWFYVASDSTRVWWSFNEQGERAWSSVLRSESQARDLAAGYAALGSSSERRVVDDPRDVMRNREEAPLGGGMPRDPVLIRPRNSPRLSSKLG